MAFVVALVLAFVVFDPPLSYVVIAGGAAIEVAEAGGMLWYSRRRRAEVGVETLVGAEATVVDACRPDGQVKVRGELWRARCDAGADVGERVRVESVDGLTLLVALLAGVLLVAGCGGSRPKASFDQGCLKAEVFRFSGGPGDPIRGARLGHGKLAVVFANQSGSSMCSWMPYAERLAGDYTVLLFDYGQQSPDVEEAAAARALQRAGAERVVVAGASVGAKAAVLAASEGAPAVGVISLSPERYLGGIDVLPAARKVRVPVLYFTATGDTWSNRAAPQLARATRVRRLVQLPGSRHGVELLTNPRVRGAIDSFLRGAAEGHADAHDDGAS